MQVLNQRIPKNSVMFSVMMGLGESEKEALLKEYNQLLVERQKWAIKVQQAPTPALRNAYNPVRHKEAIALTARAEELVPGITTTRRGGWLSLTNYSHNSSIRRSVTSPWVIEDVVADELASNPLYAEQGVQTISDYIQWTQGTLLYDLATAHQTTDYELRRDLVQKASKLCYVFKEYYKHVEGYAKIVEAISQERRTPYNLKENQVGTVCDPLMTLYEEVVIPMLELLKMHDLAFLFILSESPLVPDREVVMMPAVSWKVPADYLGTALKKMLKSFPTREDWLKNPEYQVHPCETHSNLSEYVYRLC